MPAVLRLIIAIMSLTLLSGCAGLLSDSQTSTTTTAPSCQATTSTLTGAVVLERGEHNLTTPGGTMKSGSYQDFPWQVPMGSSSRVEIVASWQPGTGAETLEVEVGSGRIRDRIAERGTPPLNFTFIPTPELESLQVTVWPSQDPIAGTGVAFLPEPIEVHLTVRQTKLCAGDPTSTTTPPPDEPELLHGTYWLNNTFTDARYPGGLSMGQHCVQVGHGASVRSLLATVTWEARPTSERLRLLIRQNVSTVLASQDGPSPLHLEWTPEVPTEYWIVTLEAANTGQVVEDPVLEQPFSLRIEYAYAATDPEPQLDDFSCGYS